MKTMNIEKPVPPQLKIKNVEDAWATPFGNELRLRGMYMKCTSSLVDLLSQNQQNANVRAQWQ